MSDLWRLLLLQDPNTRLVLLGSALLGLAAGVVGSLAVLRRRALLGDSLAHAALPGICLAYMVVCERSLPWFMFGALVMGLIAAGSIAMVRAWTRTREDAAVGIALASFFGLGIVLLTYLQKHGGGNRAGLDRFLFGQAATIVRSDVLLIGGVGLVCLVATVALMKEFRLLCFDREFAGSQGWPVMALDFSLMALVCLCTIAALPAAGVVLTAALLIIPAVTARLWTSRFGLLLGLAGAFGAASGLFGTALSAGLPSSNASVGSSSGGWPTGPMIVLASGTMFGISLLFAPQRGLIAAAWRRMKLRQELAGRGLHGPLDPDPARRWEAPR